MSIDPFKAMHQYRTSETTDPESMAQSHASGPAIYNNNPNANYVYGSGSITNNNQITNYLYVQSPAPPAPYISHIATSVALPAKPPVFHGRDEFIENAVALLIAEGTARLAILGSGGMGKTTVALALLHDRRIVVHYSSRYFISCEALVDADGIVTSLAKVIGLPASGDLLNALLTHLTNGPRVFIVLDNLETVWLVDGAPVAAVDELLGRLAQIPSVSLVITSRGRFLSQLVEWSNADSAVLEPFSLEAAMQTFQDRSGYRLIGADVETAVELLNVVDRMPLAVSLIGQLARRGNTVSELLIRWNREHNALLQIHGAGRMNSVDVSIGLSIDTLGAADTSQESLQLLCVCSMLPDGLRSDVYESLRPLFSNIDRSRDTLSAYTLVSLDAHRTLKTLSPVRHFVMHRHTAQPVHRDALYSIYFDIALALPIRVDENFQHLAETVAPEMGNLASLLLTLSEEPSQKVVQAVVNFTNFMDRLQPTTAFVAALLPKVEHIPRWKAECMKAMGATQYTLSEYRPAIRSLAAASQIYLDLDDMGSAAWCKKLTASAHRFLREYGLAEDLLDEARAVYADLGNRGQEADCRSSLGELMRMKGDYMAAAGHLSAARQTFQSINENCEVAHCSSMLGLVYIEQGNFRSAAAELETARAVFKSLGDVFSMAQSTRYLGGVKRRQGHFTVAEELLEEAEAIFRNTNRKLALAGCALEFGWLRRDQGRRDEAIVQFSSALRLYELLSVVRYADICRAEINKLKSPNNRPW